MPAWLEALGFVMSGVLLDQGLQVVRDARRHRRERTAKADAAIQAGQEKLERQIRSLENTVASTTGLLRGILAGRIDVEDFIDHEREGEG